MNAVLDELTWRGFIAHSTDPDALRAHFDDGPVTFYVGFDPTAPSIHMGNLVQLMLVRRLQPAGHRPILLVGGSTGLIGDPKQSSERSMNAREVVAEWVERIHRQVAKFVDFEGANAARVVNNYDWTADLSTLDFLRDVGKHFSVNRMLDREVVRARLESGISYTEFSYVLLQSLDYRELYRRYGCTLQTGGSDQWGNITAGVDLIRRSEGVRVHALATPLLTKADGTKFGKTESGTVWLDPEMTSPYAFHQFFLNAEDSKVGEYLKIFTTRSAEEIADLERQTVEKPHLRAAQRALADDVTDLVHPETAETATLAARVVGLDIAGVDLVCEDISQPLAGQRGAIVEVNAGPGLLMHLKPENGEPRPVGRAIVDHLFPCGGNGRIPVVGVTGSYGKTTVARLVARLLTLSGKRTGLTCSDGLFIDSRRSEAGDCAHWEAARRVLMNRAIEAAVFENGSDAILVDGLAYDRCQVGIVTNMDVARHTGRFYVDTPEQVFTVLRTQIDLVLPGGAAVLNAAEPQLVEMAKLCDGEVIFFASDPELPALVSHIEQGRRAVIVRYGQVMLADSEGEAALTRLGDIPLTEDGKNREQIENVLAAIAAAWALGITPDVMRTGVETFFNE